MAPRTQDPTPQDRTPGDRTPGDRTPREPTPRPHGPFPLRTALSLLALGAILLGLAAIPRLGRSALERSAKPAKRQSPMRSLFVWDGAIPGDDARELDLIGFALDNEIELLFLESSPVGYGQPGAVQNFRGFVELARDAGLRVVAAGGYPWWAVSDSAGLAGQPTGHAEGWAFFEAIANSQIPFAGVLDDSEPYLADPEDWNARRQARAQDYINWLRGVDQRIGRLKLYATVPFWYDEDPSYTVALDGQGKTRPLNAWAADVADGLVVMDYRDFASGPDGMIEHALGELAEGPVILAVETMFLGTDPISDKVSFWEEGAAFMETQLAETADAFRRDRNFRGFAIHDYASYSQLAP